MASAVKSPSSASPASPAAPAAASVARPSSRALAARSSSRPAASYRNSDMEGTPSPILSPVRGRSRARRNSVITRFPVSISATNAVHSLKDLPPTPAADKHQSVYGFISTVPEVEEPAHLGLADVDTDFEDIYLSEASNNSNGKNPEAKHTSKDQGKKQKNKGKGKEKARALFSPLKSKFTEAKDLWSAVTEAGPSSRTPCDPGHKQLRLQQPALKRRGDDLEAQAESSVREIWSLWEIAQAITMMLTVITFILTVATLVATTDK